MMMTCFRLCFAALCAIALPATAQQTHEEETVRNAYAKVTTLASLNALTDWLNSIGKDGKRADVATLNHLVIEKTPVYTFSDFRVGPISEISSEKMVNHLPLPGPGTTPLILQGSGSGYYYTQDQHSPTEYSTHWNSEVMSWKPGPQQSAPLEVMKLYEATTISAMLDMMKQSPHSDSIALPMTFTRYAAYTVNATLGGQSSGPHKAMFFFGVDAKGVPFVLPGDMITGVASVIYSTSRLHTMIRQGFSSARFVRFRLSGIG